jgi:hypothetical protein
METVASRSCRTEVSVDDRGGFWRDWDNVVNFTVRAEEFVEPLLRDLYREVEPRVSKYTWACTLAVLEILTSGPSNSTNRDQASSLLDQLTLSKPIHSR